MQIQRDVSYRMGQIKPNDDSLSIKRLQIYALFSKGCNLLHRQDLPCVIIDTAQEDHTQPFLSLFNYIVYGLLIVQSVLVRFQIYNSIGYSPIPQK